MRFTLACTSFLLVAADAASPSWDRRRRPPVASPKGSAAKDPDGWDRLWPDGILAGVHVYRMERPDGSPFDRPVSSVPGTINTLGDEPPNTT